MTESKKTIHIDLGDAEVTIEIEGDESAVEQLYKGFEKALVTASAGLMLNEGME